MEQKSKHRFQIDLKTTDLGDCVAYLINTDDMELSRILMLVFTKRAEKIKEIKEGYFKKLNNKK